tara:strand:+ start:861 stop:1124 length:264 start_codon:yes stop_codon:yes gene_type:complete
MVKFKIHVHCADCAGAGVVSDGHPNDPSSRNVLCKECDGTGKDSFIDEMEYDSIADVIQDYPKAIGFTYVDSNPQLKNYTYIRKETK